MPGTIAIALAAAWTASSPRSWGAPSLRGFDPVRRSHSFPGDPTGHLTSTLRLAVSAGLAWAAAVAYARGRRLEQRMAANCDARYAEMTAQAAGDFAVPSPGRSPSSERRLDDLIKRRTDGLAEMELERRRTSELRALADDYKRSLAALQDRLIILPDIEDKLAGDRAQRRSTRPGSRVVGAG